MARIVALFCIFLVAPMSVALGQGLGVGALTVDRPGVSTLAFELELTGPTGTPSYSATATTQYRAAGTTSWSNGPNLVRLRADLGVSAKLVSPRSEGFAGVILDLQPGTTYDVRITVSDSGAGSQVIDTTATTRALAPETSGQPADVVIDGATSPTREQIQAIMDNASPGDIIEFRGTHVVDRIYLNVDGTASQPIYVRGDGAAVVGDPNGTEVFQAIGNHWVVEDLIINSNMNKNYGVRVDGRKIGADNKRKPVTGFTLRRSTVLSRKGFRAYEGDSGEIYDVTLYDNTFVGRWTWNDIVTLANGGAARGGSSLKSTWNDTGIKMTGQGHSIFQNTLSGFGDSIKTDRYTSIENINISYSRNDILWGGDDGIELDDAYRNCIAYENRVSNTGTGISKQPNFVTGGPTFVIRNVLINQFLRPFKLNDGPNGMRILHNTVVGSQRTRPDYFWLQFNNGQIESIDILNNIFVWTNPVSDGDLVFFDSDLTAEQWDGNAYWPDGGFQLRFFGRSVNSFSRAQGNSDFPRGYAGARFESSGELLKAQPFAKGISAFGPNWEKEVVAFDPELASASTARTGAIPIAGYGGNSRGAAEAGAAPATYGARVQLDRDILRPANPTGLSAD